MKNNALKILAASLVLGLAAVNASAQSIKAPTVDIVMEEGERGPFWFPMIYITLQDESTVIQNAIVNRGSCPVAYFAKDGGRLEIDCNLDTVTEIQIVTNGGTFDFDMREKIAKVVEDQKVSFQVAEAFSKMALINGDIAGAFEKYGVKELKKAPVSELKAELYARLGLPKGCVLKSVDLRPSNLTENDSAFVQLDGTCKNGKEVDGRYTTISLKKEDNEWRVSLD